jgi:hypothetical protein
VSALHDCGRDFIAFWLSITQQHGNANDTISYSTHNAQLNGGVAVWR